jgi:alpha-1,3-mannosyltransferase
MTSIATTPTSTTSSTTNVQVFVDPSKSQHQVSFLSWIRDLLWIRLAQPSWDAAFVIVLLLWEGILSLLIVRHVPYTEIDWTTYLQQVRLVWVDGILDYMELKGDTGPLVYPAGFIYLYGALWKLTNHGNVVWGQYIFVAIYLATQAVIFSIYTIILRDATTPQRSLLSPRTVWCWRFVVMFLCLCGSKRIHSIFLLRLFNDGPTMFLLYTSILLCMKQYWSWACVVFSLAVSIKMNVLLFAPGLLLLLLVQPSQSNKRLLQCFQRLCICAVVQLILGLPFLLTNPISYLRKAFELDRVFQYQWTVNWKVSLVYI